MKKSHALQAALIATVGLFLGAGPSVSAPDVTYLDAQFGSVSGKVIGADGKPANAVTVRIMSGGPQAGGLPDNPIGAKSTDMGPGDVVMLGRGESTVAFAKTDVNGLYKIPKVKVGKFKAVVATPRTKTASNGVEVQADKNVVVDFTLEAK